MKLFLNLLFLIILHQFVSAQIFTDAQKYYFVTEHNLYRKTVGCPPVRWSDTLELYAQKQADLIAEHPYSADIDDFYGINIYRSAHEPTAKEAISNWAKNQRYYHGDTITAKNVMIFGHYTQIIWKETISIGCGMAKTAGGMYILVCLYNPKGNIIGQKPY